MEQLDFDLQKKNSKEYILSFVFDHKYDNCLDKDVYLNNLRKEVEHINCDNILTFLSECERLCIRKILTPELNFYSLVAARFLLIKIYITAVINDSNVYGNLHTRIINKSRQNIYHSIYTEAYTEKELQEAENFISIKNDLNLSYPSIQYFYHSYLSKDKNGQIIELIQEVFLCIALFLAHKESKENRLSYVKQFYDVLSTMKLSLATPILFNLRMKDFGNLSSCFIMQLDDNVESILYGALTTGLISINTGGVGVNLSRLRGIGSNIRNIKSSSGISPYVKLLNDYSVAFSQGGKRAASITIALDVWHIDIMNFLDLQLEIGDQRTKAYDIFPQIVITDLFMQKTINKEEWYIFDPKEIKEKYSVEIDKLFGDEFTHFYEKLVSDIKSNCSNAIQNYKVLPSMDIIKTIMKRQLETGLPYIFFKCNVNKVNPNKHDGMIPSGNLCQESFSNFTPLKAKLEGGLITEVDGLIHTCNLLSFNLANITNINDIKDIAPLAVRMLDNAIEYTITPVRNSKMHNDRYRTIGIGAMGLQDYLAFNKVHYEKSSSVVNKVFERISLEVIKSSVELSKERGAYPLFNGSEWSKGIVFGKDMTNDLERNKHNFANEWKQLIKDMMKNGIRNSQLLAIAPNTSTSLIQNATASVLPVFDTFFLDSSSKGIFPVVPKFYSVYKEYYKTYTDMELSNVIDVISSIQQWIDQGISFEFLFNLNKNITAKNIYDNIVQAWKSGCKTIYYVRSVQVDQEKILRNSLCDSCTA